MEGSSHSMVTFLDVTYNATLLYILAILAMAIQTQNTKVAQLFLLSTRPSAGDNRDKIFIIQLANAT